MISVADLELRAGARLLMEGVNFRIDQGDKIGLVGRNGAGKTTMTRVLAGEAEPTGGTVTRNGSIGYLPQDPRTPNMGQLARDRILSARGMDEIVTKLRKCTDEMGSEDESIRTKAMNRYDRLDAEFISRGGYAAEAEASAICNNLALPERLLDQTLDTLSGGQRRRVELAR
ncbi:MAG: ATP-binding cassette domain-containing protein, partial [Micrococcaceae bacterium]|nr:ATP-binding cassette domain-containing protein [Micrococcaceae bacterium]